MPLGRFDSLDSFPRRYLKTVDRFNDLTVTGFVTASRILPLGQLLGWP